MSSLLLDPEGPSLRIDPRAGFPSPGQSSPPTGTRQPLAVKVGLAGSVQFSHSVMSDSATPWTAARQASLSITNSRSFLKPTFIELVMPSNHVILCCSLLLLPSIFPSIRVFSNESALHIRWPKYWSFSFSISPSNECSGLISFRIDWLDLLAVQGTLERVLQPQFKSISSSMLSFLYSPRKLVWQVKYPKETWMTGVP